MCAVAIDNAPSGDADVLATLSVNKAALVEANCILGFPEIGFDLGEVTVIGRCQQNCITLDVQVDTVFHIDTAAEELTIFQNNLATAVGRTIIDSCLDGSSVQSYAVAHGTVVFYIAV